MGFNEVTCVKPFTLELTVIRGPENGGGKDVMPELNGDSIRGGRGDISLLRRYGGCSPFRGGGVKGVLENGGSNLAGVRGMGGIGTICLITTLLVLSREYCNPGGGGGSPGVCDAPGEGA